MGTGMDLAEAAGTPDFYAVGRLRARVAELEVEVNLLHRQRHAAQEDAANARLLAEVRQLSQGEIDRLRARVAELRSNRAPTSCAPCATYSPPPAARSTRPLLVVALRSMRSTTRGPRYALPMSQTVISPPRTWCRCRGRSWQSCVMGSGCSGLPGTSLYVASVSAPRPAL